MFGKTKVEFNQKLDQINKELDIMTDDRLEDKRQLERKITDLAEQIDSWRKIVVDINRKLDISGFSDFLDKEKKKEGPEPYLNVISESFDPELGIELKLDWNEAMINFLKRNGYVGLNEDQIIEKYLYDLLKDKALEVNKQ